MKSNRGGKRKGAGRKPAPYKTTTIAVRVRTEWVETVKEAITNTINNLKSQTMTTTYQRLYFKSITAAEDFAKKTGHHFESSSTQCDSGETFCFRVYDENLTQIYVLVVDEYSYENAPAFEQGE